VAEIVIRLTRPGDAELLAANMRESDAAELRAVGHEDLLHVVRSSVARSLLCWSAFADD